MAQLRALRGTLLTHRRTSRPMVGGAAAVLAGVLTAATPVQAQCPHQDGTIPGTTASVTAVGVHPHVVYVDDRDFLDLDDDGDAGGLWIWAESNGTEGLQRGGKHVIFRTFDEHGIDPTPPRIEPIPICVEAIERCITLFPNGFGGSGPSELQRSHPGEYDICATSSDPDTLLF